MIRRRLCAGMVALGVTGLTAGFVSAQAPLSAAATPTEAASPRPWLAQPSSKPVVAGESAEVPWRSVVLFVLIIGAGALAWRHRDKWRSAIQARPGARLSLLGSVRVGPRAHLVLAGVGERTLLLGVTDSSVQRIAWIDQPDPSVITAIADPAVADAAMADAAAADAAPSDNREAQGEPAHQRTFVDVLRGLHARPDPSEPAPRAMVDAALALAAEGSRDTVEWSHSAAASRTRSTASKKSIPAAESARPTAASRSRPAPASEAHGDIEEQVAGVALRRGRRRT